MKSLERLWPYPHKLELKGVFPKPSRIAFSGCPLPDYLAEDFRDLRVVGFAGGSDAYGVHLAIDDPALDPEACRLVLEPSGGSVVAGGAAGLAHGLQTFLQILALSRGGIWPEVLIEDGPAYRKRCFMVDMGRSVFPLQMLKRIVRILHRLKMNQLHLHLYDDEICGLRFEGLPFGRDNPHALTIEGLAELVAYAGRYHVEIVPELEAWGHVGSLVHHRPELRGGEGMYSGSSFLICEETFALMRELITQVARVMPAKATIHLGLDEAKWFPGPELPVDFTPTRMVERYHTIVREVAREQGKELTLRVWADHAGRPIPESIRKDFIIEPWQYWQAKYENIDAAVEKYSGEGKMRWMAGAGASVGQPRGAFHATRYWCKQARSSPNCDGINITFWGTNELERKFISLFAGAYYAWNPEPPTDFAAIDEYEDYDRRVFPIMRWWQGRFRDAFPDELLKEQGPVVHMGYYLWGVNHGRPVSPEGAAAGTFSGHDFLNE
ncbi:MAG: family 20 glycosylhydrolase [Opitutaceae bacterium]